MINTIANWASIVGIPIAIIGLIITAIQATQAKKASVAANNAVEKFRRDLNLVDIATNLSKAQVTIQNVKRFLRSSTYIPIPDRLAEARQILISVRDSPFPFNDDHQLIFQDIISDLRLMENTVDRSIFRNSKIRGISNLMESLSNKTDLIEELISVIRNEVGRHQNDHE